MLHPNLNSPILILTPRVSGFFPASFRPLSRSFPLLFSPSHSLLSHSATKKLKAPQRSLKKLKEAQRTPPQSLRRARRLLFWKFRLLFHAARLLKHAHTNKSVQQVSLVAIEPLAARPVEWKSRPLGIALAQSVLRASGPAETVCVEQRLSAAQRLPVAWRATQQQVHFIQSAARFAPPPRRACAELSSCKPSQWCCKFAPKFAHIFSQHLQAEHCGPAAREKAIAKRPGRPATSPPREGAQASRRKAADSFRPLTVGR